MKLIWAHLKKDHPRMLQTKFGDHPSFSSVVEDVYFFYFLSSVDPLKGPIEMT
jgi:hypothetical protein